MRIVTIAILLASVIVAGAQTPVVTLAQASRQTVDLGGALTLSLNVTSPGMVTYRWMHNGRPIQDATSATYTIAHAAGTDNGWYTVTVSNGFGAITSPVTFVNVAVPKPQVLEFFARSDGAAMAPSTGPALAVMARGASSANSALTDQTDIVAVAAGRGHRLQLMKDGTVVGFGSNDQGQATIPTGLADVVAISAAGDLSLALKSDGHVAAWGSNFFGEGSVPVGLANVVAIAAGSSHCLALRSDGTVVAWGSDSFGESSVPTGVGSIVAIAAGGASLALKSDGTLVSWGTSGSTQPPSALNDVVDIAAGFTFGAVLRGSGTVADWPFWTSSEFFNTEGSEVVAISAQGNYLAALKRDGTVDTWYRNYGAGGVVPDPMERIVVPATIDHVVGVAAGVAELVLLRDAASDVAPSISEQPTNQVANVGGGAWFSVAAAGLPALQYQWYFNGAPIPYATHSTLQLSAVTPSSAGTYSVVVANLSGSITSASATLTVVPAPTVVSVSPARQVVGIGGDLTLNANATSDAVATYQWTRNGRPISGATRSEYTIHHATVADAGWYRVIVTNHVGSTASPVVFVNVTVNPARVVVWGDSSFGTASVPVTLTDVAAVAGGYGYCLALKGDGTVVQWPAQSDMVVPSGLRDVVAIAAGRAASVALKSDGTLAAWGRRAPDVSKVAGVVSIAVNDFDMVSALSSDGTLYSLSVSNPSSSTGVSGPGTIAMGITHTAMMRDDGSVQAWSWVSPVPAAATIPTDLGAVSAIAARDYSTIVLQTDGTVRMWPAGPAGDLPIPSGLRGVVAIAAHGGNGLALSRDGGVVAWGGISSGVNSVPAAVTRAAAIGAGTFSGIAVCDASPVAAPVITDPPASATVAPGSTTTLFVSTAGSGVGEQYQWFRNGMPLAGAIDARLTLLHVQPSDGGAYTVTVTNTRGTVTSSVATLTVDSTSNPGRLVNLSVRAQAGEGDRTLIAGFVIGGDANATAKPLLIRGMGPSLEPFHVDGFLADPELRLHTDSGVIAANDDWLGDPLTLRMAKSVAAFDCTSTTSKDAALAVALHPGRYTAHVTGAGDTNGIALAEIYDATPADALTSVGARLSNISARAQVDSDRTLIVAGFVIAGSTDRTVLIRGIGPTLHAFQVNDALADPKLDLFGDSGLLQSNNDWGGSDVLARTFTSVGAFGLDPTSKDAVLLVTLPPGKYTAQLSGVGSSSGIALVEVYEVP